MVYIFPTMQTLLSLACSFLFSSVPACASATPQDDGSITTEKHLRNVRQLTFGGENAEAYFSFQDDRLSLQSTHGNWPCDQIFTMELAAQDPAPMKLVSTGKGRTTCAYFFPDGKKVVFASTHGVSNECPPKPDYSKGYVWALYDYDLYTANADGSDLKVLSAAPGYDAEATISPDGKRMVFTSTRGGDLDLWSMNLDGSDLKQLTNEIGYDGGAFYSPDSKRIVYRAWHPTEAKDVEAYKGLLKQNLVRPSRMELFVMDADGSNRRQISNFGGANFAPYFHPDGKRIIFASNMKDPKGRNFDIFLCRDNGTELEQVTFNPTFDGFPMFTRDGKKIVFASNRLGKTQGETNIFLADWAE